MSCHAVHLHTTPNSDHTHRGTKPACLQTWLVYCIQCWSIYSCIHVTLLTPMDAKPACQTCLSPDMPGVAVTEVPALQGDAIGIASVMMPSQCYGATTRAGPGGALLGLLRRSQFSSLVAQVAMASWITSSNTASHHILFGMNNDTILWRCVHDVHLHSQLCSVSDTSMSL